MPHDAFWSALMALHATRTQQRGFGSVTRWTHAEVLACLASWAAQEGRLPASSELGPGWQLPGYTTIVRVCGSLQAAWAALGWDYRPSKGRVPQRGQEGAQRVCLKCEQPFTSATPRLVRVCDLCKASEEWDADDGSWMSGTAVPETWEGVAEWWEV